MCMQQCQLCHLKCLHRYTRENTGSQQIEGVDKDGKAGMSLMVSSDGAGNILPLFSTVPGKTFGSLDKFGSKDHNAWGAPGPDVKAARRGRMLAMIAKKNRCAMNTGEVCSWHAYAVN